jgi:predicted ATPase
MAVTAARELGHPFTLALALSFDSWLRQFEGDVALVRARADEVYEFAVAQSFGFWIGWAAIMRGWTTAAEGDPATGAAEIRQGLVDWQATGSQLGMTYFLALLADAVARSGDQRGALELLREAVAIAREKGEAFWLPELHRQQAELLAELGEQDAAGLELSEAVTIAARHGARALHARAIATRERLTTSP